MIELLRVIDSVEQRRPHPNWTEAVDLIRHERIAIENYLCREDRPAVYGFDTLLGPLDSVTVGEGAESMLLNAHLVGRIRELDAESFMTITAVKLQQMTLGGSGIHPETYRAILGSYGQCPVPISGAWYDSYSSGDVVPAAWWTKNIADISHINKFHQGDVISLINGNFVSTAIGVEVFKELVIYFARFLAVSASFVVQFPGQTDGESVSALLSKAIWEDSGVSLNEEQNIQRPVSSRDGRLYVQAASDCVQRLAESLNSRLSSRSSNPQFTVQENGVSSQSQSSFLGLDLTLALTNALQTVSFSMGALQRFTQQHSEALQAQSKEPLQYVIQPPKVSRAVVESTRMNFGAMPISFTGSESGGVEDIWDLSLITGLRLREMIREAESQFEVLNDLNGGMEFASVTHIRRVHLVLWEHLRRAH